MDKNIVRNLLNALLSFLGIGRSSSSSSTKVTKLDMQPNTDAVSAGSLSGGAGNLQNKGSEIMSPEASIVRDIKKLDTLKSDSGKASLKSSIRKSFRSLFSSKHLDKRFQQQKAVAIKDILIDIGRYDRKTHGVRSINTGQVGDASVGQFFKLLDEQDSEAAEVKVEDDSSMFTDDEYLEAGITYMRQEIFDNKLEDEDKDVGSALNDKASFEGWYEKEHFSTSDDSAFQKSESDFENEQTSSGPGIK